MNGRQRHKLLWTAATSVGMQVGHFTQSCHLLRISAKHVAARTRTANVIVVASAISCIYAWPRKISFHPFVLGSALKGDSTPRKMKVEEVAGSLASEKAGEGGVPVPGEVAIAEKIGGRGSELFFLFLYCN